VTTVLSYGALLLLGYLVYAITSPFLVPLAWSAVLAIFFYPLARKGSEAAQANSAAAASTLAVTFLLIVPSLVVLFLTPPTALDAGAKAQVVLQEPDKAVRTQVLDWAKRSAPGLYAGQPTSPIPPSAEPKKIAEFLAAKVGGLLKNVFAFFLDLFVVLFALFFHVSRWSRCHPRGPPSSSL